MLIIIEGCDGVGKSSLSDAIRDRMLELEPVEQLHYGPPHRPALREYTEDLETFRPGTWTLICDRYHVGEMVYGPLYRDHSELGGSTGIGRAFVEAHLNARGALLVHVTGTETEVAHRLNVRGEDYLKPEHVGRVIDTFTDVVRDTHLNYTTVDMFWTENDVDRVISLAASTARKAELNYREGYFGRPVMPRRIFVMQDRPFVTAGGGVNADMDDVLRILKYDHIFDSGFISARDLTRGGTDSTAKWLHGLGNPRLIAVGRNAHEEVKRRDLQLAPRVEFAPSGDSLHAYKSIRSFINDSRNTR